MKHLKTIISVLILLAVCSCAKNEIAGDGKVVFEVANNQSVVDKTKSNVSDYTALPSTRDFVLSITDSDSSPVWTGKVSEWDSATKLQEGYYNVSASYGSEDEEGFDKPYFAGTSSFTIVGGQTTTVSIPVNLGNTVVKISCTQNFKNYYKDYTFKFTRDGEDIVTFVKDETKGAFIQGYKFKLEGTLTGEVKTYTFSQEYSNLEAATAYTFVFDADNVGGASITIRFNDTVETVELGDYELND